MQDMIEERRHNQRHKGAGNAMPGAIDQRKKETVIEFFAEIIVAAYFVARLPMHKVVLQYSAHVFS
jgi:hypothetical protein